MIKGKKFTKYIDKFDVNKIKELNNNGKTCIYYKLYINVNKSNKHLIFNFLYDNSNCYLTRKKSKFNYNTEVTSNLND
jgi:hypothetical protein